MFVTSLLCCNSFPSKCHMYSDKDIAVISLESFLPSSQFSFLFSCALKIQFLVLSASLRETSARSIYLFRSCHDILRDIFCHVRVLNSDAIYLISSNILGLSSVIDPFHSSSSIFSTFSSIRSKLLFSGASVIFVSHWLMLFCCTCSWSVIFLTLFYDPFQNFFVLSLLLRLCNLRLTVLHPLSYYYQFFTFVSFVFIISLS